MPPEKPHSPTAAAEREPETPPRNLPAKKSGPNTANSGPIPATIGELKPDAENPRTIGIDALSGLAKSLGEFGDLSGITFNLKTGDLVSGHQRIKTLIDGHGAGLKIERLDDERGKIKTATGETFPVRFVSWTKKKQRAANVAANSPTIQGEFTDQLQIMLGQIKDETPELFDDLFLQSLVVETEVVEEENAEAKTEQADELQSKWKTQRGQVWTIDGKVKHRLAIGDSTDQKTVEILLGTSKPFLMVTDPPYGVEYSPSERKHATRHASHHVRREGKVDNDDRANWLDAYLLFPGSVAYVWHAGRTSVAFGQDIESAGFEIRQQIIWNKNNFAVGRSHYQPKHEPCFYAVRKNQPPKWNGGRDQSTVWDIKILHPKTGGSKPEEITQHGTQKPIECMARPIRNHGAKADAVYDPFLGSGTTMIAGDQLGRRVYGIELSEKYAAVILQRMEDSGATCKMVEEF